LLCILPDHVNQQGLPRRDLEPIMGAHMISRKINPWELKGAAALKIQSFLFQVMAGACLNKAGVFPEEPACPNQA